MPDKSTVTRNTKYTLFNQTRNKIITCRSTYAKSVNVCY
jgi:hypothetical protein